MTYLLLFDSACSGCSSVAAAVRELDCPDLEVGALQAPEVREHLDRAGFADCAEPVLLLLQPGAAPRVLRGWHMRVQLTRLIGVRRSRELVRLAWMEQDARRERRGVSRRKLLGTGVLGIGVGIVGRTSAAASTPEAAPRLRPLGREEAHRITGLPQVKHVAKQWGAVSPAGVHTYGAGSDQVLIIEHDGTDTISLLDPSATPSSPLYSLQRNGDKFRMIDPTSGPMFDLRVDNGHFVAEEVPDAPSGLPLFTIICISSCVGARGGNDTCVNNCISCYGASSTGTAAVYCGFCIACVGSRGFKCVKNCRRK